MRKAISILLSIYVLLLTAAPCVDHDEAGLPSDVSVIRTIDLTAHDADQDCCSPFCICSCCGIAADIPVIFTIAENIIRPHLQTSVYISRLTTGISISVWEPPKAATC
jgi:hypothetical protein